MIHARDDYNRIQDPAGKIAANEPVFLLRAKDKLAPELMHYWARRLSEEGGDTRMAAMVHKHAELAKEWQKKNGCKLPDLPKEPRKFETGSYYRLINPKTSEVTIVYYYFNPDDKCEGFGFNHADGGGFLSVDDLLEDTIVEPFIFKTK